MSRPAPEHDAPICSEPDIVTACEHCPCLTERVDGESGNDVLACAVDEDVRIDEALAMDTRAVDCPRAGRTATWPREVKL